jgi:hypothetical protein
VSATYSDSNRGRSSLTCDTFVPTGEHEGVDEASSLFERLPVGWSIVTYDGRRYGVTKTVAAGGKSDKVLAEALDGSDVVSANLYRVDGEGQLKPCEMPAGKVLAFLRGLRPT